MMRVPAALLALTLTGYLWLESGERADKTRSQCGKVAIGRKGTDGSPRKKTGAWYRAGGDFRNTGRGGSRVIHGRVKWLFGRSGDIASGVAIATDGTIYFSPDSLYAINRDGKEKWEYRGEASSFCGSPCLGRGGAVYAGGQFLLEAVSPKGRRLWQIGGELNGWGPTVGMDGTLYQTSQFGQLLAISPGGSVKWSEKFGGVEYAPPAIGLNGNLYFGSLDYNIYCVSPSGHVLWTYPTRWKCGAPITIGDNGEVYAPSGDGQLYVLSASGKLLWKFDPHDGSLFRGGSLARDGTYYLVGDRDHTLFALSPSGKLLWLLPGVTFSPPAIGAHGMVYAAYDQALAIKPDGEIAWSVSLKSGGWSTSLGAHGDLFVTLGNGQLCCIE